MEELFKSSWLGVSGISFLTFLLGMILGHYLNIHRDKRGKLFDMSKNLRVYFISQYDNPNHKIRNEIKSEMNCYIHYMKGISWTYRMKASKIDKYYSVFLKYLSTYEKGVSQDGFSYPKYPNEIKKKIYPILKLLDD